MADTSHATSKEHTVKIFSLDGKLVGKIGGLKGYAPGHFLFPTYVWVDSNGDVYVTDTMNCRVQRFSPEGKYIRSYGERGDAWGQFNRPKGVALDTFHNVYVVDSGWSNVQIFNPQGQILLFFGGRGPLPGMLKNPTALAIDKFAGNVSKPVTLATTWPNSYAQKALELQTEAAQKIRLCLHLAKWYGEDLGHPEYAQPYYAQIVQLDQAHL